MSEGRHAQPARGGDMIARCVEYRSGQGRVTYRVNARAGTVVPID